MKAIYCTISAVLCSGKGKIIKTVKRSVVVGSYREGGMNRKWVEDFEGNENALHDTITVDIHHYVKWKWNRCYVRLFATPWTVAYQAPQSMEFSRQESWSGLPFPSSGDLPNPGIEPGSPTLQADTYHLSHQGRSHVCQTHRMDNTKNEPNVNYGLWIIMMCQCRFILCNKCPITNVTNSQCGNVVVGEVVNLCGQRWYMGNVCNCHSILLKFL